MKITLIYIYIHWLNCQVQKHHLTFSYKTRGNHYNMLHYCYIYTLDFWYSDDFSILTWFVIYSLFVATISTIELTSVLQLNKHKNHCQSFALVSVFTLVNWSSIIFFQSSWGIYSFCSCMFLNCISEIKYWLSVKYSGSSLFENLKLLGMCEAFCSLLYIDL